MGSGSDGGENGPGRNLSGQNVIKNFKATRGTVDLAPLRDRPSLAARSAAAALHLFFVSFVFQNVVNQKCKETRGTVDLAPLRDRVLADQISALFGSADPPCLGVLYF